MLVISFVGYGATNRTDASGNVLNGNNGHSGNPPRQATFYGTKRIGFNRVDSVLRLPANSTNPFDDYLRFDLDNPGSTTDPGVNGEAMSAQGASGGPLLIGGELIAGVSSTATLVTVFGATANYTRVTSFEAWIDQTIGARYSLVLDMNNQLARNDGSPDTIELRTENQFVQIIVNGEVYYSDLATVIRDVTIRGSSDDDTITIRTSVGPLTVNADSGDDTINIESLPRGITATLDGFFGSDTFYFSPTLADLNNIQSNVTVDGGSTGGSSPTDRLFFDDWSNGSRNRNYVLRAGSLLTPGRQATIAFSRVHDVQLNASPAPDATVDVYGTSAGVMTGVFGAAIVNVGAPETFINRPGRHTRDILGALNIGNFFRTTA